MYKGPPAVERDPKIRVAAIGPRKVQGEAALAVPSFHGMQVSIGQSFTNINVGADLFTPAKKRCRDRPHIGIRLQHRHRHYLGAKGIC